MLEVKVEVGSGDRMVDSREQPGKSRLVAGSGDTSMHRRLMAAGVLSLFSTLAAAEGRKISARCAGIAEDVVHLTDCAVKK